MNAQYRQPNVPSRVAPNSNVPSYGYRPPVNNSRLSAPTQSSYQNVPMNQNLVREVAQNGQNGQFRREIPRQELLVMTIDLGDGSKDLLKVFDGDDPFELAKDFCDRHRLNPQLIEPLAQNIYGNIEQVLQESVQTLDMYTGGARGQIDSPIGARDSSEGRKDTGKFRNMGEMADEAQQNLRYDEQEYEEVQDQMRRYNDERAQKSRYLAERVQNQKQQERQQELDYNQGKHYPVVRESTRSKRYEEEPEMYEMIDHDENNELIAERVRPIRSPPGNGLTEKDLSMSKGRKEEYQEVIKPTPPKFDNRANNVFPQSTDNEKKRITSDSPSNQKAGKSWVAKEEFQNEEEYLDYLINSQYGNGRDKQSGRYETTFVPHINQNSKQLIDHRSQVGKNNVHERLYNESRNKSFQRSNVRHSQSAQKTNSSTLRTQNTQEINYGTLLYHRGVKRNEEMKRSVVEKKKEKLEIMNKECTFKPEINRLSQQIMSTKARVENLPEMLIQTGKEAKDKLERARSAQKIKEMDECTFRPEINFISQRIDSEKRKMAHLGQDRCLRLYKESKAREEQQEMALRPAECTFKPSTNSFKGDTLSQMTFEQRDQKFRDRMERINYMRQLKEEAEVRDAETGEPLFKPKTGRAPKVGRNTRNLPIGDYLYNQQFKIAENKRRLYENKERSIEANMARSNETSQAIVENLMRRRLEDIFRKFDSDGDGYISSAKIDITPVGIEVLETLAPILCEMEERNQILDFESFYEQTERLFKYLTVTEKDNILLGKRESNYEPQWNFQPEINRRSQIIAQKKHPYGDFHSLYSSYIEEKRRIDEKLQEEKERKLEEELRQCSFKPRIYTSPKKSTMASASKNFGNTYVNNYFNDEFLL